MSGTFVRTNPGCSYGLAVRPSLNQLRFLLESFPVCTNNADFFPVESREFYRLTEERVFVLPHISILNFTYKPLEARFHLCLRRFEGDEDSLEVETQWVRARTSHFSYRSTVR